jgi:esterase/lipase superfamily enzyme
VYAKACNKGEITANDFLVKLPLRFGEVYVLGKSGRTKIKQLFDRVLDTQVYYLDQVMTLEDAMVHCARLLRGYLLENEASFQPVICAFNKDMYQEIDEAFQAIMRFCSQPSEDEDSETK